MPSLNHKNISGVLVPLSMNIAYYKFTNLFHLTKLISKCKSIENSLKGEFFLPNNNY